MLAGSQDRVRRIGGEKWVKETEKGLEATYVCSSAILTADKDQWRG
jgi:hypothetical protein